MSGTFCSACGARVTPQARFCTACGHRVGDDVPDETPGAATEVTKVPSDSSAPTGVTHVSAPDAPTGVTQVPSAQPPTGATAAASYGHRGPHPTGTGPQQYDAMTHASMIPGGLGATTAQTGSYEVPPTGITPTPPPGRSKNPLAAPLLILSVALVVLVVIGVGTVMVRNSTPDAAPGPASPTVGQSSDGSQTGTSSAPQTSATTSGTSAPTGPTSQTSADGGEPTTDAQAQARLASERTSDMSSVPLDGTWAAQVASQYVGVTDPEINGGSPMSLLDIWRHHEQLRNDPRFSGRRVVLVKQNDFGKIYRNKPEIWITLVLLGANERASALQWCASAYSTDVESAKKVCAARQMDPPHS